VLIVLLLLADIAGLAFLLSSPYDIIALVVFPILWGLGLVLTTAGRPIEERRFAMRLFTISLLLRVGVALAIYGFGLVNVVGDEDAGGWYTGWAIAQAWKGNPDFAGVHPDFLQALRQTNQGYYYLAGGFLYFVGFPSRVSLAFLSAGAGALTSVLIYRIAVSNYGHEAAAKAGILAAVFPSLVAWGGQTLKEPFVLLFECAIVYATFELRGRRSLRMVSLLLGCLLCLYTLRFYAAYVSATASALVLWSADPRRSKSPLMGAVVVAAVLVGLFASGLWQVNAERLSQLNLQQFQVVREDVSVGTGSHGSGIALPYNVSTPAGALVALPLSLLAFLLSPFPWQALGGSARLKFAMVDVALWWWLIPRIVVGMREAWRIHRAVVGHLLVFILPLTIFYSLTFGNAGLAFRERAQILVLLLVFAGLGLVRKQPGGLVSQPRRDLSTSPA
jgi:hypothetical protein